MRSRNSAPDAPTGTVRIPAHHAGATHGAEPTDTDFRFGLERILDGVESPALRRPASGDSPAR
ncbi:hypothetical protein [Streptomyces yaizuensis]|uniref:Tetracycline repressor TetR C-terminal domain-containing protein n=1 Tax=Streptomyces yaizuensis TaxID=2989713 RepID=A0ABQ5PB76_9ACTN|nr:hypothetical protein SYYSPA8_35620 [Streptomyces sp. YSPA8]